MPGPHAKRRESGQVPYSAHVIHPEEDITLKAYETCVYATTTASGTAFTVTLPKPDTVIGQSFLVYMVARNSTKDITVVYEGGSDITLDLADEYTVLQSFGKEYIEIASNHA